MSFEAKDLLKKIVNGLVSSGGINLVDVATDPANRLASTRFQETITSADATSATQVKAKTADNKMYILTLLVTTDTEMNIQFQDDTGTPNVLVEQMYIAANSGFPMVFHKEAPLVVDTNKDFDVITSVAGNISVHITGYLAA
jgi:hypothetical protein